MMAIITHQTINRKTDGIKSYATFRDGVKYTLQAHETPSPDVPADVIAEAVRNGLVLPDPSAPKAHEREVALDDIEGSMTIGVSGRKRSKASRRHQSSPAPAASSKPDIETSKDDDSKRADGGPEVAPPFDDEDEEDGVGKTKGNRKKGKR
jgi:hypothetical protein